MFDALTVRKDFPIFCGYPPDKNLVYLDSTATTLKPRQVADAVSEYYLKYSANVFRGIYSISERATAGYEESRSHIAQFIGATSDDEILFVRNATEALNLVYYSFALNRFSAGDEVITTILEHHSNFVPWQRLQKTRGIKLVIWKTGKDGTLDTRDLDKLVTAKTRFVAISAASNVTGTIVPVTEVVRRVKQFNPAITVLVDAAQAVPHMKVNVSDWGADFVAFSGHKMLGPTGIGVLWGKRDILESMEPFQYGGDMIREVHETYTEFADIPHKFEAGTPHIAGVIGLGRAVQYLSAIGMDNIRAHEKQITSYCISRMTEIKGLTIYGPLEPDVRGGVVSFTLKGIHPHDIAQILDSENICIRVGYHCAQPLHEYLRIGPTARASFYIYTTIGDIDSLIKGISKVRKVFA